MTDNGPVRRRLDTLVIASHNAGKVREIAALLAPFRFTVHGAAELGLAEPEETGTTFEANAELKARAAASASGRPALADDSGLCVDGLGGQPGIHSARWAGPERDFTAAMRRVHEALDGQPSAAHFTCALALAWPDGACHVVSGHVHGTLIWPPRGSLGFGYDPMFVAIGHARTFGEIDPATKHRISHRAGAFNQLIATCFRD